MTKKLLDHHNNKKPWEVNSDSDIGFTKSLALGKHNAKACKQELARPLYYNRKFPEPKPILSNGVIP